MAAINPKTLQGAGLCRILEKTHYLFAPIIIKAGVGSLFLVSLGKNSIIIFQYIVIQVVLKNPRLLRLSLALGDFSGSFQREHVPIWSFSLT